MFSRQDLQVSSQLLLLPSLPLSSRLDHLQSLQPNDSTKVQYLHALAQTYQDLGQFELSFRTYHKIIRLKPCARSYGKIAKWKRAVATTVERLRSVETFLKRGIETGGSKEDIKDCRDRLILLLMQDGRDASKLLEEGGYTHYLSYSVLNYPEDKSKLMVQGDKKSDEIVRVYDDFFSDETVAILQSLFHVNSPYFSDHDYHTHAPPPYFSYLVSVHNDPNHFLDKIVLNLYQFLSQTRPELAKQINVGEYWAHCRGKEGGHQLHYDTENEGRDGSRRTIISVVIYLSNAGGPTFMTNQGVESKNTLGDAGWFVFPNVNRVLFFDGRYLHGVIPGKGPTLLETRTTLMVGFWDQMTARNEPEKGPNRPSPVGKSWTVDASVSNGTCIRMSPQQVDKVWESKSDSLELPHYQKCFQGF